VLGHLSNPVLQTAPSVTFYAVDSVDKSKPTWMQDYASMQTTDAGATIAFPDKHIKVPAGTSRNFTAKFTMPVGLKPQYLPIYSGYIVISSKDGETVRVPYQGMHTHAM
jgi:hypothetical protein